VQRLLSLETDPAPREQLLINTLSYYGAAERFGALASPLDATAAVAVAEAGKGSALAALLRGSARSDELMLPPAGAFPEPASDAAFASETARIAELARKLGPQDAALAYTLLGANAARRFELAIGVLTRERVTVTLIEQPDTFLTDVVELAKAVEQNQEQTAKVVGMRLYSALIAPIAGRLAGKDRVFISPHLRLHTLPWNALHDGTQFLVHRFAFSRSLPLLLSDGAPRDRAPLFERNARARWVLAINPRHAQHESLPGLEAVGTELRRRIPAARVLGPHDATAERVAVEIRHSDVLLFAGHASYDATDPLRSALFTTAEHAEPSSRFWPSDRLEARALLSLDRRLDLAILLGCETARLWRGTSSYGDEAVGLARAFLLTGAHQVIGTLWPVLDRDAEDFLRAFVSIEGDDDVVRNVQRASRCLAEQRCENRGIAAWASFSVESR
jgi:CHAT domain-containing protein